MHFTMCIDHVRPKVWSCKQVPQNMNGFIINLSFHRLGEGESIDHSIVKINQYTVQVCYVLLHKDLFLVDKIQFIALLTLF